MMPTTRNSVALNIAWAMTSEMPARAVSRPPKPTTTEMKPSWLTVPYASTRLRSFSRSAWKPPSSIVKMPSETRIGRQGSSAANDGARRASR